VSVTWKKVQDDFCLYGCFSKPPDIVMSDGGHPQSDCKFLQEGKAMTEDQQWRLNATVIEFVNQAIGKRGSSSNITRRSAKSWGS
jgi:hypothetical protein